MSLPVQRNALRVLFVDDSAATRQLCAEQLGKDTSLHILGVVPDPASALRRIHSENPDVVVIDIEMPRRRWCSPINTSA